MRTIKFRAWDTESKRMMDMCELSEHPIEHIADCFSGFCEIMQFTGLHDKNGREIYEGDYFRVTETGSKFEVYYGENSGCYRAKRQDGWHFDIQQLYPIDNWEVTGNIYENPELLADGGAE